MAEPDQSLDMPSSTSRERSKVFLAKFINIIDIKVNYIHQQTIKIHTSVGVKRSIPFNFYLILTLEYFITKDSMNKQTDPSRKR
jgi:hypothetical protein